MMKFYLISFLALFFLASCSSSGNKSADDSNVGLILSWKGSGEQQATRKTMDDDTKLLQAAKHGQTSRIHKLVNGGASLEAVDESGATAFCVALKNGHQQTAQELMVFGSNKNHKDKIGRTPLHYAAIYNAEIIVGALVIGGVDTSVKDSSGKTARDWAKEKGHSGVLNMFDKLGK